MRCRSTSCLNKLTLSPSLTCIKIIACQLPVFSRMFVSRVLNNFYLNRPMSYLNHIQVIFSYFFAAPKGKCAIQILFRMKDWLFGCVMWTGGKMCFGVENRHRSERNCVKRILCVFLWEFWILKLSLKAQKKLLKLI